MINECNSKMEDQRYKERLVRMVGQSAWMMDVLRAVRSLGLPSWCIGAGAVRNLVWDALSGRMEPSQLPDVDVAYFDATDLRTERDAELQSRLQGLRPEVPWEVTNQAAVHLWFESYFGHAVEPLKTLDEAVGTWPEYATSVAVWLDWDETVHVIAPWGLADLFGMVMRRNPIRASNQNFKDRVASKRYAERWPDVVIVMAEDA